MALKVIWEQSLVLPNTHDDIHDAVTQCVKSIADGESLQFSVIDDAGKVYSVDLNEEENIVMEVPTIDLTIYQQVENAIIRWNNDGTKTAGTLTRELLTLLNK